MINSVLKQYNGFNYALIQNDMIGNHIILNLPWEPEVQHIIEQLITTTDKVNVIDLGANFGYHTLNLCKAVPNGIVHSFEPLRIIFQQLNANIFINGFDNVIAYNKCIGNEHKIVEMEPVNYNSTKVNIGNTKIGYGGDITEMITLDSLEIKDVTFIKIDIQGSELEALKGATKTIITYKPIIIIEIEDIHLNVFNTNGEEVLNYIKELGYDIYRIENEYPCDHLCIPKGENFLISKLNIKLTKI